MLVPFLQVTQNSLILIRKKRKQVKTQTHKVFTRDIDSQCTFIFLLVRKLVNYLEINKI